jgi:lambda family phage portal protein
MSAAEFKGSRILARWNADRQTARRPVYVQMKGYDAARQDHLTYGWKATNNSADHDIRTALERVRGRSRDLAQNDDYMRKFLRMVAGNVIGHSGFLFKSLAADVLPDGSTQPDIAARDVIERHFKAWCSPRGGCDITRHTGLNGLLKLLAKSLPRDGEYLVRKVRGEAARNRYQFALHVLDVDRLDVQRNGEFNGNEVVMGVEIDLQGAPVAYHLLTQHPGSLTYKLHGGQRYERVPASDIFHGFIADRPEQHRGMPWAHTSIMRMQMLGKFQYAALAAARKGAETVGVLHQDVEGDSTRPAIGEVDTNTGQAYETSLPGTWETIPLGYTASAFESKYPDAVFGQFVKDSLRGIASGLGVAYNGLANDLEGVNFSSIRAGVLEERDVWIELQNWFVEQLVEPIFHEWLNLALTANALTFPAGAALPVMKFDKFYPHSFTGRRWQWVDPDKDGKSNERAVSFGWKTNEQVAAEQGFDFWDNIEAIALERQWATGHGVPLGTDPLPAQADQAGGDPADDSAIEPAQAG